MFLVFAALLPDKEETAFEAKYILHVNVELVDVFNGRAESNAVHGSV